MTFDGPGQQAALHERGLFFRSDWEHVLTPVLDAMAARPDVDATRVAAVGIGQAGYLLPRAMAFERAPGGQPDRLPRAAGDLGERLHVRVVPVAPPVPEDAERFDG